ncbi:MAG: DUF1302 family protein [Gammaproteobacteria bacterium]|nr:DUF1302 family protein [Gammaproteobacteria bacterium]
MKKYTIAQMVMAGGLAGGTLYAGTASAIEWNFTGFVRQEIAYSLNSDGNPNNDMNNPFVDRVQPMITHSNFGDDATSDAVIAANPGLYLAGPGNANFRAGANTYWGDPDVFDPAVRAARGYGFGGSGNRSFAAGSPVDIRGANPSRLMLAGGNTSSPVDCQLSQVSAIAAGANRGNLGFGPNVGGFTAFPGVLCPAPAGRAQRLPGGSATLNAAGPIVDAGAFGAAKVKGGKVPPGSEQLDAKDSMNFNLFNTRLEFDIQAKISDEFSAYMKTRIYYDGTRNFTDGKIGDSFGPGRFNQGMWGGRRQTLLEWNSPDAIVDLPAFYLDWNRGPLWLRAGNQVIAWGEAYFFRTMDVANGLDLRRHLTLGPGAEEYQDQRIGMPGLRLSYTFENGYELDAFVQMFNPTILPGQNTAYNVIATSGARLNERAGYDDARGALNYGMRMTMPFTEQFTGIVGVVNRRNQDGVVRNVDAPAVNNGRINTGCLNQFNDTANFLSGGQGDALAKAVFGMPTLDRRMRNQENGCGSTFAPDPRGTPSLQYWKAIRNARLDNANFLQRVINEFPAAQWAVRDIFNFGDEQNFVDTYRTVEGFRSSFGPFIQWVGREFKRETIFMVGGNYVVESDNDLLDQLIIRGEVSVTPNKRITNDLSFDYTKVDDVVSALILEKYYRFSDAFPATYMVFQWMHRTSTDLFGRDLDKNGTKDIEHFIDGETGYFKPAAFDPEEMKPEGNANADYVVFAFQQPFPNLIWRLDAAILVDTAGGYLFQPGVRYRPSAKWQWDLYATLIGSPGGNADTITETLDFADEMFVRATYFF